LLYLERWPCAARTLFHGRCAWATFARTRGACVNADVLHYIIAALRVWLTWRANAGTRGAHRFGRTSPVCRFPYAAAHGVCCALVARLYRVLVPISPNAMTLLPGLLPPPTCHLPGSPTIHCNLPDRLPSLFCSILPSKAYAAWHLPPPDTCLPRPPQVIIHALCQTHVQRDTNCRYCVYGLALPFLVAFTGCYFATAHTWRYRIAVAYRRRLLYCLLNEQPV